MSYTCIQGALIGVVGNCCLAFTVPAGSRLMAMQLIIILCLYMGVCWLLNLFYVEEVFCVFSGFLVFHHCLPYKVLYCIFTNFPVMSAKDTLETYLQLEAYY